MAWITKPAGITMINGIHHVSLTTHNLDRMVRFYCDVLGFEVALRAEWQDSELMDRMIGLQGSAARVAILKTGNSYLEIFEYQSPVARSDDHSRAPNRAGYTHICLDVSDAEAEYQRLLATGMKFTCPPPRFEIGVQATYGHDPDGNIIEFQQTIGDKSGVLLSDLPLLADPRP